jgi:hypothetical protein
MSHREDDMDGFEGTDGGPGPASFPAAAAALAAIEQAVHTAAGRPGAAAGPGQPPGRAPAPEQALAALLLLRELRQQLAGWERGLIETAREAGASWAELAGPLGVTSRQAAERRYLRLRPAGEDWVRTGDQRVKAERDRRAADRAVTAWARGNAADLRALAAGVTAAAGPGAGAVPAVDRLLAALGQDDATALIGPLTEARPHLGEGHPALADRLDRLTRQVDRLRRTSDHDRRGIQP